MTNCVYAQAQTHPYHHHHPRRRGFAARHFGTGAYAPQHGVTAHPAATNFRAARKFALADRPALGGNGDGQISKSEFTRALGGIGLNDTEFRAMGANRFGQMTIGGAVNAIKKLDRNHDGVVTRQEVDSQRWAMNHHPGWYRAQA